MVKNFVRWIIEKLEKKKIIEAILWFLGLCLVLVLFYHCKSINEYYVSIKDKVLIVFCMLVSSIFILMKQEINNIIAIIGEAVVIILFPFFAYAKLEPLVNTMESNKPFSLFFNCLIIFSLLVVVYGGCQNAGLTALAGGGLVFAFYVVDYFTLAFRGSPVLISDILSIKTAVAVSRGYSYVLNSTIMTAFYEYSLLVSIGLFFSKKKSMRARIVIALCSLVSGISILAVLINSDIVIKKGFRNSAFIPVQSAEENGLFLNSVVNLRLSKLEEPKGYSVSAVKEIMDRNTHSLTSYDDSFQPNIIVIMNESFTDIDYLETVSTSEETIPFFKSLKESSVTGTLISSILGGNTPNSEFEFLTGCSLAFMPAGTVAYQQMINGALPTVASMLKEQNYDTVAVHLYEPQYFNRNRVYPLLGIDKFISEENYPRDEIVVDYPRANTGYAADKSSFEMIKIAYRENENPFFGFCVTIQNHGGYWTGMNDISVLGQNNDYANEYVSLLKMTDDSFASFIEYFKNEEEPTIVCMYGDHQPYLFADDFVSVWDGYDYTEEEKRYMQAKVPFVIWANFDIVPCDMGEMSINYLGPTLLKIAKLPMSDYFWYLDSIRETIPVISAVGFVDCDGNYFTNIDESKYQSVMREYEYLQYNYLKGKVNREFYE